MDAVIKKANISRPARRESAGMRITWESNVYTLSLEHENGSGFSLETTHIAPSIKVNTENKVAEIIFVQQLKRMNERTVLEYIIPIL